MKKIISHSVEETGQIAHQWLLQMMAKYPTSDTALVVGLSGQLGAGKTAFTKALAKELGIVEEVTSPTFVLMKSYNTTYSRWKRLIHIDAYRLEGSDQKESGNELKILSMENLMADKNNLIVIEWPENVKQALSKACLYEQINFTVSDDQYSMGVREVGY